MDRRVGFSLSALLIASLLSACASSGGGGSKAIPQASPKNTTAPASLANVAVKVTSPSMQSQSTQRRAKYISPATASMSVTVNGGQATTINITTSSPNCSLDANSDLICTATVSAPEGPSDTFVITLYDAGGDALSTATVMQAVMAGTNNLNVTLNGVVDGLGLGLGTTNLNAGAAATTTLAVYAIDHFGNIIVGPGTYSNANGDPVTVNVTATQNTPTVQSPYTAGSATLSTSSFTGPTAPVTVSYDGNALLSTTFTVSATNATVPAGVHVTLNITPTVYEYAFPASTGPEHMAIGPDKQLWVGQFGTPSGLYHFVPVAPGGSSLSGTTISTPNGILGEAAGSDGNVYAVDWNQEVYRVTTAGVVSILTVPTNKPDAVVDGGDGNIYVQYSYYAGPSYFPIGDAAGSITPAIYGNGGGNDITVGPDKRVWATSGQGGCCYVEYLYAQQTAVSTIQSTTVYDFGGGLPGAGLSWVISGPDGNMWYSEHDNDTIGKLSPSATNASQRVDLQLTSGTGPYVIAGGPSDGYVYFIEKGVNKIGRVPTTATSGNLGLTEYTTSASNDLNDIIVGPDGNMWFIESDPTDKIGKLAL